jgi:mannose-1-phosphate guanylyltransferase
MRDDDAKRWAIVLAGGDGTRLSSLTTTEDGVAVPKQFWSLRGGPTLLEETMQRAQRIAPRERICAVVAASHRPWWSTPLSGLSSENVLAQPRNRGTGIGILWPLAHIVERESDARVALLPSDHHVYDEAVLAHAIECAFRATDQRRDAIVMLGMTPDKIDPELGYIVPGEADGVQVHHVERFVEKPPAVLAQQLIARGALWSTFIIVARVSALVEIFESRWPAAWAALRTLARSVRAKNDDVDLIHDVYDRLPHVDFSHEVIAANTSRMRVLAVPECGWNDLGTPGRVVETLHRLERNGHCPARPSGYRSPGSRSLAAQCIRARAVG